MEDNDDNSVTGDLNDNDSETAMSPTNGHSSPLALDNNPSAADNYNTNRSRSYLPRAAKSQN